MRIAMLTNNYKPFIGGVPISIERLSESLRALGHEVYIFAPTYENQVEEEGIIRYGSYKKKLSGEMVIPHLFDPTIEAAFKKLAIDVIHVHHPNMVGWIATHLGKKYDIPVVYTYHTRYEQYIHHIKGFDYLEAISKEEDSRLIKYISDNILRLMKEKVIPGAVKNYANKCDTIFAPTALMKDVMIEMGVQAPIEILPTGLSDHFFVEDSTKASAIRRQYIGDKKYLFCTVSRLAKEKNISFVIEGLGELKKRIGDCFRTIVIGDGPLRRTLEEKVKVLGLTDNVIFLKSVPNALIKDYYSACDLFLFASKSETQGIVLLEAMAARNPIVAVEASGVVEVVKNGVNGYMTHEDKEEWVGCIERIVKDEELLDRLRGGAYETARSYGGKQVAEKAQHYYRQAIVYHMEKEEVCGAMQYEYQEIYTR